MSNFIFSANIVLPIFFIIVLGYLLKCKGLLTKEFRSKASTLVFYYALPCSLFRSVAGSDMKSGFDLKFVIYVVGTTLAAHHQGAFADFRNRPRCLQRKFRLCRSCDSDKPSRHNNSSVLGTCYRICHSDLLDFGGYRSFILRPKRKKAVRKNSDNQNYQKSADCRNRHRYSVLTFAN